MINVGVIGGSGYTGGELLRLLVFHPEVNLTFVYSTSKVGQMVSGTHPDLLGVLDLTYTNEINDDIDVLFLCIGHGKAKVFLENHSINRKTKIIDLSRDFRLAADANFQDRDFVYGLPTFQKAAIKGTDSIANPGCFATAIQQALLPLGKHDLLQHDVHINAVTGSTGAGASLSETTHFSWRTANVSWYKAFTHQHLGEINQTLSSYHPHRGSLYFIPNRGNFSRGIFVTAYTKYSGDLKSAQELYHDFYSDAPFTMISDDPIALKSVVNTNNNHIHLHKVDDTLLITSAIDNLLKGASGQAVHNMNLILGLPETLGLRLKSTFF